MRGHIRKRGNGYTVIVDLPRDAVTGKRRQKWLTAKTKREAEKLLTKTLNDQATGGFIEPSKTSTGEYLTHWLTTIEATIRPSSHRRFSEVVNGRVIPKVGNVPLMSLSPMHIQELYSECMASGLSSSTVALYHNVVHQALDQAVKW